MSHAQQSLTSPWQSVSAFLKPLASLQLTVVLFVLSIILVLAGTLAQVDYDIWYVVHNYFRCLVAWIELKVFFPRAWDVPGIVPFPGGWFIGAALGANLLAAHAMRFKVTGKGRSLWLGSLLIAAGVAITYLVIQSGLDDTVESELSPEFCRGLWHALRAALGSGTLLLAYVLALNYQTQRQSGAFWLWTLGAVTCALLAVLSFWLFTHPEAQLDPSGLRILWQLFKGGAAGLVLLAGCYFVFGRRAGIVLLHGGIALLMFSELLTGLQAVEANMRITEGQTLNFAEDYRVAELAIIDNSDAQVDQVTVVPEKLVRDAFDAGHEIEIPETSLAVRVVDYLPNAMTRLIQPSERQRATRGEGLMRIAQPRPSSTGASSEQTIDLPAAYVELLNTETKQSLGTVLLWAVPAPSFVVEPFQLNGADYEIALRFKQLPKPYSIELIDFKHDRYVGTDTPKNFSSEVRLRDAEKNVDRTVSIWMNNPLRYGGDTLYQASFDRENPRVTTLQVMTNTGWMIPYVACMLVGAGMLAHMGSIFFRFASRQKPSEEGAKKLSTLGLLADWRSAAVWVPAVVVLVLAGWVAGRMRLPSSPENQMQIQRFGQLPVAYQGRVKPFDTLARNALRIVSGKQTYETALGRKEPAVRWLLDVLTDPPTAQKHRVLRIDNLDVLQALGMKPRSGFRYSLIELLKNRDAYSREIGLAHKVPSGERSLTQAKFAELGEKISLLSFLRGSFTSPANEIRTDSQEMAMQSLQMLRSRLQSLSQNAPRPVPPSAADGAWSMLIEAEAEPMFQTLLGNKQQAKPDEAVVVLRTVLDAYASGDVEKFNAQLAKYEQIVADRAEADAEYDLQMAASGQSGQRKAAEKLDLGRLRFEVFFNHFNPFVLSMALYVIAFVLAAGSWLWATAILSRSANWLLWFTFFLHTLALVARVVISGRPPVTNLYSSAVFIGWGAVLFALVFERIYRFGIGNLLAAAVGFPTLFIAHNLAGDGDTFQVLQAVLDTQFWLATHVVCITLGYSTTLLAGALGVAYVIMGQMAGRLDDSQQQHLVRMIYGTICFATFFSFIGTVLGGLWADDSWGRFWGWDPKENGALIIVLWNAVVLHARWGGLIQRRGLAVLAVFGNVVTAWSWFGVNAMGVGLHSYGFRSGMVFWLTVFVLSQLAIMLAGGMLNERRVERR